MKKILILVLLVSNSISVIGQMNIFSIIHKNNEIKFGHAKHIEWETYYYGLRDTSILSRSINFNKKNQIVYESSNDNDKIKQKYFAEYDSLTGLKRSTKTIISHSPLGDIINSISYSYDNRNFLIKTNQYKQDQLDSYTILKNDEYGNPIELQSYDKNDIPIGGLEKAIYQYDRNRYIDMVFSKDGNLISRTIATIDFSIDSKFQTEGLVYNDKGDIIKDYINENTYDFYEYKYDKLGNWIEFKKFQITIQPDGKEKKKLTNVYIRRIKYWKE
jgi:hypothetical protein